MRGVYSSRERWTACLYWILLITTSHGLPLTTPHASSLTQHTDDTFVTVTLPTEVDYDVESTSPTRLATWTQPRTDESTDTTDRQYVTPSTDGGGKRAKKPADNDRTETPGNQTISYQQALDYLVRYNYMSALPSPLDKTGNLYKQNELDSAISHFQWFMGLNQTGVLDDASLEMMSRPRCGLPDVEDPELAAHGRKRDRRYTDSGYRWGRSDLRYKITYYTADLTTTTTEQEIADAFELWSQVTKLTFRPVTHNNYDIEIQFRTYNHGDGIPFDGPGKILAHAFYPPYGDIHLDDSERWTADSTSRGEIRLKTSMAHEIGHALGLGHSNNARSLMAPTYNSASSHLYADDINGIQSIYGLIDDNNNDERPFCRDASVDAVTVVGSTTYLFKDSEVYKMDRNGMARGYPRPITELWSELPVKLDAALHTKVNGEYYNYFFKGRSLWRYEGYQLSRGWNGVSISEKITGLPNYIDSIHRYPGNGRVYAFKGDQYYRLKSDMTAVDDNYPKDLSIWWKKSSDKSIRYIDAAFDWPGNRNKVYFFIGGQYRRYDTRSEKLSGGYPKSTAHEWFGCSDSLSMTEGEALQAELSLSEEDLQDPNAESLASAFDEVIPPPSAARQPSSLNPLLVLLLAIFLRFLNNEK